MIVVSGCLAGLHCRYDGGTMACQAVVRLVAEGKAIPLCLEQLGELSIHNLDVRKAGNSVWQGQQRADYSFFCTHRAGTMEVSGFARKGYVVGG